MALLVTASGVMTPTWRAKDDIGDAIAFDEDDDRVKLVQPEPNDYITPPDGVDARLRITGRSELFDMESRFSDVPTKNFRMEFLVLKISGGGNHGQACIGKRFTTLFTPTTGPKSNLGKLISRLRERDVEPKEEIDVDGYIGTEFVAPIVVNEKGYANIIPETIKRGKTVLSPFLSDSAPAPEKELAGVAAGGDIAFEGDGEEDL